MSATANAQAAATDRAEVGPMVCGFDIEDAVIDTLKAWLGPYLCEAERRHAWDVGSTPWPKGWAITGRDLQKLNSDQLPCVVIMAGGILTAPRKEGPPGVMSATWALDVGVVFSAAWGRNSRRHAQLYARAIQLCLEQRPLGIPAEVDWRGEVYDEIDFSASRTYSAAVCSLNVEVRDVAWAAGGPPPLADPPTDPTVPYEPWVTVTEVDITVENVDDVTTP